jgi:hypothetical protein
MRSRDQALIDRCRAVLDKNYQGQFTAPASSLYPHQWFWDSCFAAIGLRHINPSKSKSEIESLRRGAWSNGMVPHIIFSGDSRNFDYHIWDSHSSRFSPPSTPTSGITQPPMLAEATLKTAEKLPKAERLAWLESVYGFVLSYHQWIYAERQIDTSGLAVQIHPYETGLDNSPAWINAIRRQQFPWWIRMLGNKSIVAVINNFRRDTQHIPPSQRIELKDAIKFYYLIEELKKRRYEIAPILKSYKPLIQDVAFNSILIRANRCLAEIAKILGKQLPVELKKSAKRTEAGLDLLWDAKTKTYYSRTASSGKLIKTGTVASLLPICSGALSQDRAKILVGKLHDKSTFDTNYPVPSVPVNSRWFRPKAYWQGASWINTNWLIIQGLKEHGCEPEARELTDSTLGLVRTHGAYEYFSPLDGTPAGAADFSWTAALTIDLLKS